MERIHKYGKQSEKLSDLQLQLLDLEPAVSSDEIETEIASGPLPEAEQKKAGEAAPRRTNKPHLERIEEIVACAAEQCKCGRETQIIGYEETEVLGMKPAVHFVRVIKRACARCVGTRRCDHPGTATHRAEIDLLRRNHYRLHRQEIFGRVASLSSARDSDARSRHRCSADHDQRRRAACGRIADPRGRHGEADLLAGGYIQADETHIDVQTPDRKGKNHRGFFWQYSAPMKGVVFDFKMTHSKQVAKEFFKNYGGILHTDGYVAYEKDIGT
jgi:hypothetical protein